MKLFSSTCFKINYERPNYFLFFKVVRVAMTLASMLDFEISIRTTNLHIMKKIYYTDTKENQVQ